VAKVLCYGAMTITCTNFGVEALATHSIMMRLFFFFACFGDSLSQTAQSFLPAVLVQSSDPTTSILKSRGLESINGNSQTVTAAPATSRKITTPSDLTRMIRRLLTLGVWIGILNSQISTFIVQRCGHFVTKDIAITSLMKQHSNFMGLSLLVHPFIMLLEGIVLANRDYRTLIFTYATTMVMHFTILSNFSHSFPAVWRTFFLFQCTRLSLYAFRVFKWWWTARSLPTTSSLFTNHDVS
jgi:Na+-driven multidrug efflux pump